MHVLWLSDGKTFKKPRRPFEKERLDAELKLVGEYGLRNKRELWRVQMVLSKIRNAARNLLTLDEKDPKRIFEGQVRRMHACGGRLMQIGAQIRWPSRRRACDVPGRAELARGLAGFPHVQRGFRMSSMAIIPLIHGPHTHGFRCHHLPPGSACQALMRRMYKYGLLNESQDKLDYVLALQPNDFLERRLQTVMFKQGLAKSIHHARVLIRQKHIRWVPPRCSAG